GSGKTKREEQDGWVSSLIPNELIIKELFDPEAAYIEKLREEISEIEIELDELVESAKLEGSEEHEVLYDCLSKNKAGEAGNSFTVKAVRDELKEYKKNTEEYRLLKQLQGLMGKRSKTNREIREKVKELETLSQDRILTLTEEEIDSLVYEKW